MVLHMQLMVNGQRIGHLAITRIGLGDARPDPAEMCRYHWEIGLGECVTVRSTSPLEHRYGDGAWDLVANVLNAAYHDDPEAPIFGPSTWAQPVGEPVLTAAQVRRWLESHRDAEAGI